MRHHHWTNMAGVKLGLIWGYWGALPPPNIIETTKLAEDLGFDSVWSAESWGSDAFSPLAYLAGHTSRIKLGTSVVQLAGGSSDAVAVPRKHVGESVPVGQPSQ